MFTPWVRRKSLKRLSRGKRLVLESEPVNPIRLVGLSAILIGVGMYAVQMSLADNRAQEPTPTVTPSPSPTATPTPTLTPEVR
jgi:hypothetical protein